MDEINWKNIDLNLLVVFSYLYRYRSVSVAAEKSFVSQSAMSHSLNRLRGLFDDVLFVRKGHKMEPSERAHQVAPQIHQLLSVISGELLAKQPFSPQAFDGVCRIGMTDYAEFIFAPKLYDAIRLQAPKAQVSFINVNRNNYVSLIEQEKLDVVIGSIPTLDEQFESERLYTERHVCLCDGTQVDISAMTVAKFAAIEQALVSPDGQLSTQVDKLLASQGLSRRVTVASRNFLTIRSLLSHRALIAIVPERMALAQGFDDRLTSFEPPIEVADFDISLVWHSATGNSEKGMWLREVIRQQIH
ncbi:LysR family transcriptional regulator [Vibrio vulnificus]|uniref:LysR family transcriptional regulator n=1 Tax=Vibrio vulnificus TaxID=672 RepID=UPI00102311D2|nr:LysR family transcriptional regulator [Vibrio vulnificus]EKG2504487.1 LysR family transcriptional regulator [Vibrio vulnificus]MCU8550605.1 LysR family transcriptional regulator [Vibrio vulnificus]RZQ39526.1 LysR family transcriptional regulator [Vibrio vulnificus]HAS8091272.1 LysR family transcriptional regulator [Vibrio vulnificus]HAS8325170.1 LysR family transcriptional regulator [Vibrio vulnificus]